MKVSHKHNFPHFYADLFHKIKYYIQNLRCSITILPHKYLHILTIEKYLEQNVFSRYLDSCYVTLTWN